MSNRDEETWKRLASEIARGAEHDSNDHRPFSQCLPGTRVDLLNALEASLTQEKPKIFWLFGGSGSGKSSVAYSISERLRKKGRLAATFFFSRKHVSRSSTDRVFLTIAYRIGVLHPRAKDVIVKVIQNDPELLSPERSRREQFQKLVVEPLRSLQHVWVTKKAMVFDAADEGEPENAEQIKDLVRILDELLSDPTIPISSILFTSRPLSHLESLAKRHAISQPIATLRIENFDATEDVKIFLRDSFQTIYDRRDLQFVHPQPWPSEHTLKALTDQIHGHFIIAATLCRLVHDAVDPITSLDLILTMYRGDTSLDIDLGNIGSIYQHILSNCDPQARRPGVECLSDIVMLAEPLSLSTICRLFAGDVPRHVMHLSAVVHLPPIESLEAVKIYHTSLRDYLADGSQSRDLCVDPADSHRRLLCFCLRLMQRELKQDICGLGDPSKLHTEIEDFDQRRDASISSALRYASLYWSHHLQRTQPNEELLLLVLDFLQKQLLHFLEVSSVLGHLQQAVTCLADVHKVVSTWEAFNNQQLALELLYGAWRLGSQFFEPISISALHVYESALPMCPLKSYLREAYFHVLSRSTVSVEAGLVDWWDYVIRSFDSREYSSITVSPDGRTIATLSRNSLKLLDTTTGAFVASPGPSLVPDRVVFAHDSSILACQYRDGRVFLWYFPSNTVVDLLAAQHDLHTSSVPTQSACAFSPDDRMVASGTTSGASDVTINVLDRKTAALELWRHRQSISFPANGSIHSLAFSNAALIMVVTQGGSAYILDLKNQRTSLHVHRQWPLAFHWHTFCIEHDTTLHVGHSGIFEKGVRIARTGHVSVDDHYPVLTDSAKNATPITLPSRREVDAVLLGNHIYTPDRQIDHTSRSGHGHFLSAIKTHGNQTLIVDLSLLYLQTLHRLSGDEHLCSDTIDYLLLGCRPDRREAIIARVEGNAKVIGKPTTTIMAGWKTTFIPVPRPVAPSTNHSYTVSRNMDVLAYVDEVRRTVSLHQVESPNTSSIILDLAKAYSQLDTYKHNFSPKSTYFAFVTLECLHIWHTSDGLLVGAIDNMFGMFPYEISFSDDETQLAILDHSGFVTICSLENSMIPISCISIPTTPTRLEDFYVSFASLSHNLDILMYVSSSRTGMISLWQYKHEDNSPPLSAVQKIVPRSLRITKLLSSPHLKRFRYCGPTLPETSEPEWASCVIDVMTPSRSDGLDIPLPSASDSPHPSLLIVDDTCPSGSTADTSSWSNVMVDIKGWLWVGSRRVCWLPPQYRPVDEGVAAFADRVIIKVRATHEDAFRTKSMVLHLKNINFHYYDW